MPLSPATLTTALTRLMDRESAEFAGWPVSLADAAENWALAATTYFSEAVAPPLAVGALAGESAFIPTLVSGGVSSLGAAFSAYASAAAVTVTSAVPGSLCTPPPTPLDLNTVLATPAFDAGLRASVLAGVIDAWARTGVFAPPGVPGGTPWT